MKIERGDRAEVTAVALRRSDKGSMWGCEVDDVEVSEGGCHVKS